MNSIHRDPPPAVFRPLIAAPSVQAHAVRPHLAGTPIADGAWPRDAIEACALEGGFVPGIVSAAFEPTEQ